MKMSDFQNLDPNNIGSWPMPAKVFAIVALCALVLGGGYYIDTEAQLEEHAGHVRKEAELKRTFEALQQKAANLEPLKRQLQEMEQSFGTLLKLLPNRTQIEGLLVDISKSGLASGLEFELFKPGAEQPAEFYAIQPINIQVTGTYHQFGEFISAVAALPRIVTVHNIDIKPVRTANNEKGQALNLSMGIVAKTYRYLEEDEG